MTLAIAPQIRAATSGVWAQSGAVLLALMAATFPAGAFAQDAAGADAGSENGAAPSTGSDFTPLKEVLRVRDQACGRDQFDNFLYWYTLSTDQGGWLGQVVFTNYLVKIASLDAPELASDWEDRTDYIGQFRITSRDLRFSRFRPKEPVNQDYRRISVTRLSDTAYRVDWAGGPGFAGVPAEEQFKQAGAYVFEYMHDCWYLTQDLR